MSLPPDSPDPSDEELMLRSGAGDEAAFRELVERHQSLVRGTLYRMLPSEADAEDLAQQVFVRVWQAGSRYRPEAKFTTWLLTILRNLVFNDSRRRSRARFFSWQDDTNEVPPTEPVASPTERPDEQQHSRELSAAVEAALQELPEKQRLALVLHRFEGRPHEEVARVLGTSVPSTKSLIFRARESLRITLHQWL
jgi:RNA polymerase sigma-70 factor, ECF subfamily